MAEDGATVTINTVEFEAAMQRLRSGVRAGIIDPQYGTLTVQARLLSEKCQLLTPPRNVGQGNAAVMRDLSRVYFPQSAKTYRSKSIRRIIMRDDRAAWDAAAKNFAIPLKNTRAIDFSEGWHQQNKISRGRASGLANGKRGAKANLEVVTLGPQASLARAYMQKIKARVGWAKAGWSMGIVAFGGRVAANWVARHSIARGRVVDGRSAAEPFVQVGNDTGWAQYRGTEGERIVRNVIASRSRDMQAYFETMMRVAAQKAAGTSASGLDTAGMLAAAIKSEESAR